ncbi:12_t:CDS:2 [Entrophospora sp. SA101]|nr:12_t:CDS:2 [Entrophospora sp. SA101]
MNFAQDTVFNVKNYQKNSNIITQLSEIFVFDEFLKEGWALKENQKFGSKGGNINKSDHYNAQSMHSELLKIAEEGEIDQESIPKVESIQSWIIHCSAAHKTESSRNAINIITSDSDE